MRPLRLLLLPLVLALVPAAPAAEGAATTTSPVPVKTVMPEHPEEFRGNQVVGEAAVECLVTAEGKVAEAQVTSASHPAFGEAALVAVRQWEFKPAERNGVAVPVRVTIPFRFDAPLADPLEAFAKRRLFVEVEGEVVPAERMPAWPMPKQLLTPNYPPELRGSGKRGKAVVSVVIDREGRVMNPKLVKATWPEFGPPALATAVSMVFPPQLGPEKKPMNVSMDLQFDFRDDGGRKKAPPKPAAPEPDPMPDLGEP